MNKIEKLSSQHEEILILLGDLSNQINIAIVSNSLDKVDCILSELSDKLKMHLHSEDLYLYPNLMSSNDTRVRELSLQFYWEISLVRQELGQYFDKWNTMSKVGVNLSQFKKESELIVTEIRNRINKEERMLFYLFDEVNALTFD